MKIILLLLITSFSTTVFAQAKNDTISLTKFNVDKNGKAEVAFKFMNGISVSYRIEGKTGPDSWTLLEEAAVTADDNKKLFSEEEETFDLELNSIKEVRLVVKCRGSSRPIIKTVTIP